MTSTIEPAAIAPPRRILIVEDEAVIAMDMAQHLREFGYDVVGIAASGERAQQLVAQSQPDLIMMDIVIKGAHDGIETADRIRHEHDIPVVFLTAYGDATTLERAKGVAPYAYLMKPFRPHDLRTTIEVALNRHGLERRLRESEHWLTKTLQCIGDGIIATDPQGLVRFMNPVAEALTGAAVDAVRGLEARDVFRLFDEGAEVPADLLTQALRGDDRRPMRRGLLYTRHGDPTLYVDAGAAPIRDNGRLLGAVLVFRDVTQRRLDEQELGRYREHLELLVRERTAALEAATLEAQRASKAKSEFLSSMSHELRTPMNAVLGFSELLAMEPLAARQAGYVQHIRTAGNHLLQLINDLLDLSTIDAGRLVVAQAPVAVATALARAERLIRPLAAKKQVTLTIDAAADGANVIADLTRLTQVLVNLLSNAIKYNHQGGQVHVACTPSGADRLRISVTDTGAGIAPDKQGLLFRSFERLGVQASGVAGTGIGLAFSKRLAELMQGELGFSSELGVGSTFWIELRRA